MTGPDSPIHLHYVAIRLSDIRASESRLKTALDEELEVNKWWNVVTDMPRTLVGA
jgi:hypothetical protein